MYPSGAVTGLDQVAAVGGGEGALGSVLTGDSIPMTRPPSNSS